MRRTELLAGVLRLLLAAVLLSAVAPKLWGDGADSFRLTWEAAAGGAEKVPWLGAITVWDEAGETLSPQSALPLGLARLAGAERASASFTALLVGFALFWAFGVRRLAVELGASGIAADAVGLAASVAALVAANGHIALLSLAPALWLVAAVARGEGFLVPLIAVALLSRAGFLLGFPIVVLATLVAGAERGRSSVAVAAIVGFAIVLWLPESPLCHHLRVFAPQYFSDGPYQLPARSLAGAIALPFGGGWVAMGVTVAVGVLAIVGAFKAESRGRALLVVALVLVLIGLGSGAAAMSDRRVSPMPASLAVFVMPSLRFQAIAEVGLMLALPCLLALAARALPSIAGLVLAVGLVPLVARDRPATLPPAGLARAVAEADGAVLALPLSIANDLRWRSALPGDRKLQNGLQALIDRNVVLVARELRDAEPADVLRWSEKLGVKYLVVDEASAAALGSVIASAGGESLVRAGAPPAASSRRCIDRSAWTVTSSVRNRAVSIAARAIDGDLRTRWGSGGAQRRGDFFEIDLGHRERLDVIELELAGFVTDYPRGFVVLVSSADGAWRRIANHDRYLGEIAWGEGFAYYDGGKSGVVRASLHGVEADRLRIELVRDSQLYDWSIAEICVRGESAP